MANRTLAAAVAVASSLFAAAPALGATYTVTGFTDGGGGCESVGAGFVCPSVRSALSAAGSNLDPDRCLPVGTGRYVVAGAVAA